MNLRPHPAHLHPRSVLRRRHPKGLTAVKIEPGSRVVVTDASGTEHAVTATTDVVRGRDFPVVWVDMPRHDSTGITNMPWPADAVRPAAERQRTQQQEER